MVKSKACSRCGQEGNLAKNFIRRRMENSVNPLRDLGGIEKLMQTCSQARASASTSREIKKSDTVVIGTLSILRHYTFTLFDSGSIHSFIFVRFVTQAAGLEPLLHVLTTSTQVGEALVDKSRVKR